MDKQKCSPVFDVRTENPTVMIYMLLVLVLVLCGVNFSNVLLYKNINTVLQL